MFHWICPECGREIPPSVKECPACDPRARLAPVEIAAKPAAAIEVARVPEPVQVAVAPSLAQTPFEPAPDPLLALAEMIRSAQAAVRQESRPAAEAPEQAPRPKFDTASQARPEPGGVAVMEVEPVPAAAAPEPLHTVQALARQESALANPAPQLQIETIAQTQTEPEQAGIVSETGTVAVALALVAPESAPAAEPVPLPEPQTETVAETIAEPADAIAVAEVEPVPVAGPMVAEMIRTAQAVVRQESKAEPVVEAPPEVIPEPAIEIVPESAAAAAPQEAAVEAQPAPETNAEPEAVSQPVAQSTADLTVEVSDVPAEPLFETAPEPVPAPAEEPRISITQFFPVSQAIALLPAPEIKAPAPLADAAEINVAPAVVPSSAEAAPQPIDQTRKPPITQLANEERPPSGSWLKLAPLQDYTAAATESMRPAPPPQEILGAQSAPKITLPGPALPPNLVSLQNAGVVTVINGPKLPRKLPGWLISGMLMLGIPLAGGALLLYFQPLQHSSAEAKAPAPAVVAAPPPPVTHSLADYVEVTGIRFLVDFNKKSEIHYLVVNHSGAELSDMTVYVTVHAADTKAGQPPLCRFSFRAPGLGPFESKEMTSPIEKLSRSVVLPDWQDLRADVQIGQ